MNEYFMASGNDKLLKQFDDTNSKTIQASR